MSKSGEAGPSATVKVQLANSRSMKPLIVAVVDAAFVAAVSEREAVNTGHAAVNEQHPERNAGTMGQAHALEGSLAILDRHRPHAPSRGVFSENLPVRGIIVHDEDGHPLQVHRSSLRRERLGKAEADSEVKRAAYALGAFQPDAAAH